MSAVFCREGVREDNCVAYTLMSASALPCNQVMTLSVTSLPQGIAASKANMRLMSAIQCVWVPRRHASAHTHTCTQRGTYSYGSILPITAPYSPGAHNESQCLPQWVVHALRPDHPQSSETEIDIAFASCSFSKKTWG